MWVKFGVMISPEARWAIVPVDRLAGLQRGETGLVTLDWSRILASDPWLGLLLPGRDYNRELLAQLEVVRLPPAAIVGAFLAHPFLDLDRLLHAVERAGGGGIAAFPGISRLTGGFAATADQGGLSLASEAQRLQSAADCGFVTVATVGAPGLGPPAVAPTVDWVVAPPRVPRSELPAVRAGVLDYRAGAGSAQRLPLTLRREPAAP